MTKAYISFPWCRPVRRNVNRGYTHYDRGKILNHGIVSIVEQDLISDLKPTEHKQIFANNIIRRNRSILVDNTDTLSDNMPSAWVGKSNDMVLDLL